MLTCTRPSLLKSQHGWGSGSAWLTLREELIGSRELLGKGESLCFEGVVKARLPMLQGMALCHEL